MEMLHGTGKQHSSNLYILYTYTLCCINFQYTYPHIKTPIFLLNARYDTWQLDNILQLGCRAPNCTAEQMMEFENFGEVAIV